MLLLQKTGFRKNRLIFGLMIYDIGGGALYKSISGVDKCIEYKKSCRQIKVSQILTRKD